MGDISVGIDIPVQSDDVVSAARGVTNLANELRQLSTIMRQANSIRMHSLRRETDGIRKSTTGANTALDVIKTISPMSFGMIAGGAAGATTAIMALIGKVVNLGVSLAASGVQGGIAFARFSIATGQFRENTLTTLGILLKSKTVAQSVFDEAVQFAAVTPFSTEQVITGYKDLISKGFNTSDLKRTFTAIGDLAAANPGDASIMGRISAAMGKIKAGGKMSAAELNQLSDAGLSQQTVMAQVAKIMGTTADEARKAMSTGKVGSDIALEAIVAAIEKDFGGTMSALSKTLTGLWSTLVSKPAELITRALDPRTTGKFAGGIASFYESVKSIVGEIGGMFFESDGKTLTKTGNEVVETINAIGNALKESLTVGKAFFEGLLSGLSKNKDGTTGLRDALGNLDLKKLSAEAFKFGEDVAKIADAAGLLSTALAKLNENDAFIWAIGHAFSFAAFSVEMLIRGVTWVFTTIAGLGGLVAAIGGMIASPFISLLGTLVSIYDALKKIFSISGGTSGMLSNLPGGFAGAVTMPGGSTVPTFAPPVSMPSPNKGTDKAAAETNNYNSLSISVSGGMMPQEIAQLVRNEVKRAMESL